MLEIGAQMVKELREETKASMMQCKKALVESNGEKLRAIQLLKEWGMSLVSKKSNREAKEGAILLHSFSKNHAVLLCVSCETDFVAKSEPFLNFCNQVIYLLKEAGMSALQSQKMEEWIQDVTGKCGEKIALGTPIECKTQGIVGTYLHSTRKCASMVEVQCPESLWDNERINHMAKDLAMQVVAMSPISVSMKAVAPEVQQEQRSIFIKQMEETKKPAEVIEKIVEGKLQKYFSEICLLSMPFVKDSSITVEQLVSSCVKDLGQPIEVKSFQRLLVGT